MLPTTDAHLPDDESAQWAALDRWQAGWYVGRDVPPEELCPDRPGLWAGLLADIGKLKRVPRPDDQLPDADTSWPDIPGYVVTGELGRGGMGVVLAAREKLLDRDVAVKLPLARGAVSRVAMARFRREAEVTARLNHPGVPPVYTVGELADGRPYMVLRRLEGDNLAAVFERRRAAFGSADWLTTFMTLRNVVQVVAHAHARGVIHRDLKPANVMSGPLMPCVVLDWGLAGSAGHDTPGVGPVGSAGLTLAGQVLGTPAYMAPEQARGESVDARADVFALAAMMAEFATGRRVYGEGSVIAVLDRAARGQVDVEGLRMLPKADQVMWRPAVLLAALDPDSGKRPADAAALYALLTADDRRPRGRVGRWADRQARKLLVRKLALRTTPTGALLLDVAGAVAGGCLGCGGVALGVVATVRLAVWLRPTPGR